MGKKTNKSAQFKEKIDTQIEKVLPTKKIEVLATELKAKKEKIDKLKAALKAEFAKFTDDLIIHPLEMVLIFKAVKNLIPPHLSNNIKYADDLMKFIGINLIPEQKKYLKFDSFLGNNELFARVKEFKDEPWAEEFLLKAITMYLYPDVALTKFSDYKEKKWAKKILDGVLKIYPETLIIHAKSYADQPWAKDLFASAAEKKPKTALLNLDLYGDLPWIPQILEELVIGKQINVFEYIYKLKKYKWAKKFLSNILKKTNKYNNAFVYFENYENQEWAKNIIALSAQAKPDLAFQYISEYMEMDWAPGIILKQAPRAISSAIKYFKDYKDQSWSYDVLKIVGPKAKLEDLVFLYDHFEDIERFKEIPMMMKMLLESTSKDPRMAFTMIKQYKDKPYAKNIILRAISNGITAPYDAFMYLSDYNNMPWVKEVLSSAIQHFSGRASIDNRYIGLKIFEINKNIKNKETRDYLVNLLKNKNKEGIRLTNSLIKENIKAHKVKDMRKNENWTKSKFENRNEELRNNFWKDLASQQALKISPSWLKINNKSQQEIDELRVIIARNLYFQGKEVTRTTVKKEYKNLLKARIQYENVSLFKNRNVVYGAHNELWGQRVKVKERSGNIRYGDKKTLKYIEKQGGHLTLIRPGVNTSGKWRAMLEPGIDIYSPVGSFFTKSGKERKACHQAKRQILAKIKETKPPLTFYFNGHGGPDGLYLSNNFNIKITSGDIATALKARMKKYPNETPAIMIFESCYNATFLRKVYKKLGKQNSLPISIGASEYNQLGWSDSLKHIINLGRVKNSTIGTIMQRQRSAAGNVSVYIPAGKDKKGNIRQIAERKEKKTGEEKNHA